MNIRVNPAKFQAPTLRDDQVVSRKRLFKRVAHRIAHKRFTFIVGQPGQGKTTFAHQFLRYQEKPFCWYRLEREDNDPLFLANGLLEILSYCVPDYDPASAREMLSGGAVKGHEVARLSNAILKPITASGLTIPTIAFDDCHLLERDGFGRQLLHSFLNGLPSNASVMCISRSLIFDEDQEMAIHSVHLDNDFLTFNGDEAQELFQDVLELRLPRESIGEILKTTGGWPMGLIMLGFALAEGGGEPKSLPELKSADDYFNVNIKPRISKKGWENLLRLSLLDEFTEEIAQEILPGENAREIITKLLTSNYFLRRLGGEGKSFEFHHLFSDYLRRQAKTDLPPDETGKILGTASRWCVERGEYEKALTYAFRHGDLDHAEELLRSVGTELHAANRLVTLNRALSSIPPEKLAQRGTLSFFAALSLGDVAPTRAAELLEQAAAKSREEGDGVTELLASSHAVFFNMMVIFDYMRGLPHLRRVMELMDNHAPALSAVDRVFVFNAVAMGQLYMEGNGRLSFEYSGRSMALAKETGRPNVEAAALIAGALVRLHPDLLNDGKALLTRLDKLLHDQRVSSIHKLNIRFLFTHYSFLTGDWVNWRHYRTETAASEEAYLIPQGIFGDFFHIQDMDYALTLGDHGGVEKAFQRIMEKNDPDWGRHVKGLALGALSVAKAMKGDVPGAVSAIQGSFAARQEVGGGSFMVFQMLYAGAAFAILGNLPGAKGYLEKTLALEERILGTYVKSVAHLNLALACFRGGADEEGAIHAQEAQKSLSMLTTKNMITAHPGYLEVFGRARKLRLEPPQRMDIIQNLFDKAITEEGEVIPCMRVSALGGLGLSWNGKTLGMDGLTPVQRQMLAHLLCAPGFKMEKEALASRLWTDSPREKAIANFDMALSRLRKAIDDLLGLKLSRHYLTLKNGVVGFDNCQVDITNFEDAAQKGLGLPDPGRGWEKANKLREAVFNCNGEFLKGIDLPDEGFHRREELLGLLGRVAAELGAHYLVEGQFADGAQTARKALLSLPADVRMNKLLIDSLWGANDLAGVKAALDSYGEVLRAAGFTQKEILDQLSEIKKIPQN